MAIALLCYQWSRWYKVLNLVHVLRSVDFRLHYWIPSFNLAVCAKSVITFDTIIALEMVWPHAGVIFCRFFSLSINHPRGSVGSYGPIILIAFSSRFILSIAPQEFKSYWIICSAITCPNPINWSARWDMNTGGTSVTIWFFYFSVYGGASSEKWFILSEPFGSERLLLGGPYCQGAIAGVVRWHKCVPRLCHVILCGHCWRKMSVPAPSDVWRHRRLIYTDKFM